MRCTLLKHWYYQAKASESLRPTDWCNENNFLVSSIKK